MLMGRIQKGNDRQVLVSVVAENKSPRGFGVQRQSARVDDLASLWSSLECCEGFYFLCEVGAGFSAVSKERCGRMRGLRKTQKV